MFLAGGKYFSPMDTLWLLSGAADISGSLAKLIASAPRSARSPVLCFGKQ